MTDTPHTPMMRLEQWCIAERALAYFLNSCRSLPSCLASFFFRFRMTIPEFRAASSRAKNLPLNHNAFRAPSAKDIKKNRTLLFGGNLRGDLHGYPENSGLLWREKLLFEQRLMKASPPTRGNSQHMPLRFDAVVDLLGVLGRSDLRRLIVDRKELSVELRRKQLLDIFNARLNPRPTSFPLAPFGDIRDTNRRPDDVIVHHSGYDGNGAFKHGIDALCIPHARKVHARLPSLCKFAEHGQRVGHYVGPVSAVVPRLCRHDPLGGAEDEPASNCPLEIELIEPVG